MKYLLKASTFASSSLFNYYVNFKDCYTIKANELQLLAESSVQPIDLRTENRRFNETLGLDNQHQPNAEFSIQPIDLRTENKRLGDVLAVDRQYQLNEAQPVSVNPLTSHSAASIKQNTNVSLFDLLGSSHSQSVKIPVHQFSSQNEKTYFQKFNYASSCMPYQSQQNNKNPIISSSSGFGVFPTYSKAASEYQLRNLIGTTATPKFNTFDSSHNSIITSMKATEKSKRKAVNLPNFKACVKCSTQIKYVKNVLQHYKIFHGVPLREGWTAEMILDKCATMKPMIESTKNKIIKKKIIMKGSNNKVYNESDFLQKAVKERKQFLCSFCHSVFESAEYRNEHMLSCSDKANCIQDALQNNQIDLIKELNRHFKRTGSCAVVESDSVNPLFIIKKQKSSTSLHSAESEEKGSKISLIDLSGSFHSQSLKIFLHQFPPQNQVPCFLKSNEVSNFMPHYFQQNNENPTISSFPVFDYLPTFKQVASEDELQNRLQTASNPKFNTSSLSSHNLIPTCIETRKKSKSKNNMLNFKSCVKCLANFKNLSNMADHYRFLHGVDLVEGFNAEKILDECKRMEPKMNSLIKMAFEHKICINIFLKKVYEDSRPLRKGFKIYQFLCPFCHNVYRLVNSRNVHIYECLEGKRFVKDAIENNKTKLIEKLKQEFGEKWNL